MKPMPPQALEIEVFINAEHLRERVDAIYEQILATDPAATLAVDLLPRWVGPLSPAHRACERVCMTVHTTHALHNEMFDAVHSQSWPPTLRYVVYSA